MYCYKNIPNNLGLQNITNKQKNQYLNLQKPININNKEIS